MTKNIGIIAITVKMDRDVRPDKSAVCTCCCNKLVLYVVDEA